MTQDGPEVEGYRFWKAEYNSVKGRVCSWPAEQGRALWSFPVT